MSVYCISASLISHSSTLAVCVCEIPRNQVHYYICSDFAGFCQSVNSRIKHFYLIINSFSNENLILALHLWKDVFLCTILLFGKKLLYQISVAVFKKFYAIFHKIRLLLITVFHQWHSLLGKPLDICVGFSLL